MPDPEASFLVNPYEDPVRVVVRGKACFQNCGPVSDFLKRLIDQGRRDFVIDFEACTGMDSTFMGILAGAVRRLSARKEPWKVVLCQLKGRNLQTIRNLGLDRLMEVSTGPVGEPTDPKEALPSGKEAVADSKTVLTAHEDLASIDEANQSKFQDVIDFMRSQNEG